MANPLGDLGHWLQDNPVARFADNVNYINPFRGNGAQTLYGDIGHNLLGGRETQMKEAEDARLAEMINSPGQNPYADQPNPYAANNPGLLAMLAGTQSTINRGFADAQQDARRSLAQRGALGTAQETSLIRQLAMDRNRALSGAQNDLTARNYDKGVNFNLGMMDARNQWDESRRREQLGFTADRRDRYQEQANRPVSLLANLAGMGAQAATRKWIGG